jgi:hypothetical protein
MAVKTKMLESVESDGPTAVPTPVVMLMRINHARQGSVGVVPHITFSPRSNATLLIYAEINDCTRERLKQVAGANKKGTKKMHVRQHLHDRTIPLPTKVRVNRLACCRHVLAPHAAASQYQEMKQENNIDNDVQCWTSVRWQDYCSDLHRNDEH